MKWIIYNLAFALVFPFLLPGFLLRMLRRGGYRLRMGDRFAVYPPEILERFSSSPSPVWIHAVSVGEVQVAIQFMNEWRRAEKDVAFCLSTTSSTGWKIAEKGIGEKDTLIYNPLDFPNFVKSALRLVKPRALILTESEIWPVFIRQAKKMGTAIFLINARVSDRSAPRYALARWFFKDVFNSFTRIFSQSELDTRRLMGAGAKKDIIETTGSFKFDTAKKSPEKEAILKEWLGEKAHGRILLGASTWPGEDIVLLDIYKTLPEDITLVLAPRHFEKASQVEENIRAAGFECVRRSRGESAAANNCNCEKRIVFLADTTGELMGLYALASVVFVGKSLCEHGSQNMIEPCLCGKPTIVGPYTENFRPVMSDLKETDAIKQVADKEELADTIRYYFSPEGADDAAALGERAAKRVASRKGVVASCVGRIRSLSPKAAPSKQSAKASFSYWIISLILVSFAIALGVYAVNKAPRANLASPSAENSSVQKKKPSLAEAKEFRFSTMDIVSAYIALAENPKAKSFIALGEESKNISQYLAQAGLEEINQGPADIIIASGENIRYWPFIEAIANPKAILVWLIDIRAMKVDDFRMSLEAMPGLDAHIWMPTEDNWLVTTRLGKDADLCVRLDDILEIFASEKSFTLLADANCTSPADLFASYAGDEITIKDAFGEDLDGALCPERIVTEDVRTIPWLETGDLDRDIADELMREIRSTQVTRRNIIRANISARRGKMEEALDKWHSCLLKNPNDTMLLARLHRLGIAARTYQSVGNMAEAANCFAAMISIKRDDPVVLKEYAKCLNALGDKEFAAEINDKAQELEAKMRLDENYLN